jgi:hypothetical protein
LRRAPHTWQPRCNEGTMLISEAVAAGRRPRSRSDVQTVRCRDSYGRPGRRDAAGAGRVRCGPACLGGPDAGKEPGVGTSYGMDTDRTGVNTEHRLAAWCGHAPIRSIALAVPGARARVAHAFSDPRSPIRRASGVLLGGAFLGSIPHALERADSRATNKAGVSGLMLAESPPTKMRTAR